MPREPKPIAEILSRNVRTLRERKKLTQDELGEKASLPRSTISNIEGERYGSPRSTVLQSLADALNVSVADLMDARLAGAAKRSKPRASHPAS